MSNPFDLATVGSESFESLLNEKFAAQPWDGPNNQSVFDLELVRIVAHPLAGQEGRRIPFSLFFNGPAGVSLDQSTYAVTHPQTGELPLFLVPVARKENRVQLQAVIN